MFGGVGGPRLSLVLTVGTLVRRAVTEGISGSGLGLSLVRKIALSHGGSVEVETAPGAVRSSAEESDAQADPAG
ncbi:MAG TPA: ATP-binding protein [Vicinamibacteria bacterium]|nr:ATP-binding protein [Vicinamibacteria bacterium]